VKSVIRFTLAQKVFFNLVFIILMAAGAYCVFVLPVERFPPVDFGKVFISTSWRGASPSDVETLVTREIEDALDGLDEVEYIRSKSMREFSSIEVKFNDDTDYEDLYDELRFKVLSSLGELPDEVDPPTFRKLSTSEWLPVVTVNLTGERSNRALVLMAEEMEIALKTIPGVEEVRTQGEYEREFHVYLDPDKLAAFGVTFEDVAAAIQRTNASFPAGDFSDESGEFVVLVDEKFRTREQVVKTIVRRDGDGSFVTVGDVISDAVLSYRDPGVISTVNGVNAVALDVVKKPAGNALDIKAEVERIVQDFTPGLEKEGVSLILTRDSTTYINESIGTLGSNMLVGIFLVCLIVWAFMGVRNAGLTTIGIPFAFLVTMLLMQLTGNSLNEITLFSFVLVSGIIVDDAIVVLENIYRHVQLGKNIREAVITGASEVMLPVVSATLTTVAAFLPMLIMTGSTGEFFAQIPKAVTFALIASLIECLLILPLHYLDFGPKPDKHSVVDKKTGEVVHVDGHFMRVLRRGVNSIVTLTFRFRFLSLFAVFLLFVSAMGMLIVSITGQMSLIKIKFFPDDYKLYYINVEGPSSTTIDDINTRLVEISEFVLNDGPGMVLNVAGYAGFQINKDYEEIYANNLGNVVVTLPEVSEQKFDDYPENDPLTHLDWMRERLNERFGGGGYSLRIEAEKDGPPTGNDVNVRILGGNFESVDGLFNAVQNFLRNEPDIGPYLTNLDDDQGRPSRVFRMSVDKTRAREYDLTTAEVAALAAGALDGRIIGKYRVADEEIDLKLRMDPEAVGKPEDALGLVVLEHPSGPVRLGDVVTPTAFTEPGSLNRYGGERAITITADILAGAPVTTPLIVNRVQEFYNSIRDDYPGASVAFGGAHENTSRSYNSLFASFILAIFIIYMILATQFRSYFQPIIILSAVVFSLIGVIFGKFITQSLFTVNSFIATVGVTGVVVNDSLVLLDFINRSYRAGMSRREAVLEGIRIRLRPILLTTLTTSLGLLPMSLGIPSYSLVWGTMASTFVTGLATATFLTLFIVPVEWDILMQMSEWRTRRKAMAAKRKQTQEGDVRLGGLAAQPVPSESTQK
jgi:HAE1 family hydrophobic/amphiphilic exporter-1